MFNKNKTNDMRKVVRFDFILYFSKFHTFDSHIKSGSELKHSGVPLRFRSYADVFMSDTFAKPQYVLCVYCC